MYVFIDLYSVYNCSGLARSGFSTVTVSVRRAHVVLSTAGFKGGGKSNEARESAALPRGIQKASHT